MTGIERLREFAKGCRLMGYSNTIGDIADQIEREQDAMVADSPYDALPPEDREAIAWVREHGGLDEVKRRWKFLSHYADHVPRSCMERRLARLQRQIDESHAALRRRNQRISVLASEINRAHNENRMEFMRRAGNYTAFADEVCKRLAPQLRYVEGCTKDVMDAALEALDRRLMPEGIEWPLYESGEPVRIGDDYECWCGETHAVSSVTIREGRSVLNERHPHTFVVSNGPFTAHGKRVKRPAVPAADGEPIREGVLVSSKWVRVGSVRRFDDTEPDKAQTLKVLEAAADVVEAWKYFDEVREDETRVCGEPHEWASVARNDLLDECADVIQATLNLVAAMGVEDFRPYMKDCERRNRERGRITDGRSK